mgnify:FL=1
MKNIAQSEVLTLREQISYQEGAGCQQNFDTKPGSKYYPVLIRKGRRDQHP